MVNINYSESAVLDLEQIGDYIAEQLKNPQAALDTVKKIQDAIDRLSTFPMSGVSLSLAAKADTDYHFLICGNYLAFYRSRESEVFVDRILYGRRDCLAVLFGELPVE
ncbi:MAG: type II toxin-antitoxin system RelE/ParE family toxin [Clostridiales bacterium]|nr:type II toxin-antitoxin system RelE/ParE family toxin [Clostridiales bacterium]